MSSMSVDPVDSMTQAFKKAIHGQDWGRARAILLEAKAGNVSMRLDLVGYSYSLTLVAGICKDIDFWAEFVTYPAFEMLKNGKSLFGIASLEVAAGCNNIVAAKALLRARVDVSAYTLFHFSKECKDPELWAMLVENPQFHELKNKAYGFERTPLENAAGQDNTVAAQALLRAGVDLSICALCDFSRGCKDRELWAMVVEHPQFHALKNEGSPVTTPLEAAAIDNNAVAAKALLDAGVDLSIRALCNFSMGCRDRELWAMVSEHPQFHTLKNVMSVVEGTPIKHAANYSNSTAWTYLKLAGAEGSAYRPLVDLAIVVRYFRDLETKLSSIDPSSVDQRQARIHFAERLARVLAEEVFEAAGLTLFGVPNLTLRLWLSLIDNGDLPANIASPDHRPQIAWLVEQARAAGATEAILSQQYHATIEEQAWAFIALYRMNPSEFVEKLSSPEAKAFRENFSRDVLKKINILAPTEYAAIETTGIFERGESGLQAALKLLQKTSKDPSRIGAYIVAVTTLGNAWEGLKEHTEVLEALLKMLAWANWLSRPGFSMQLMDNAELFQEDIWRALGLLTIGKPVSEELKRTRGFVISDAHKQLTAVKILELLNASEPTSTPFAAAPMGGAGGEVAPLSDDANRIARVLLQALGKEVPAERITTLEQFRGLVSGDAASKEAKDVFSGSLYATDRA